MRVLFIGCDVNMELLETLAFKVLSLKISHTDFCACNASSLMHMAASVAAGGEVEVNK